MRYAPLLLLLLLGCDDEALPQDADCRDPGHGCAAGLECVESTAGWACAPRVRADAAPPIDAAPVADRPALIEDVEVVEDAEIVEDAEVIEDAEVVEDAAALLPHGAACEDGAACASGECFETPPGGICRAACAGDGDCPSSAVCAELKGEDICLPRCADGICREGWVCDGGICRPHCARFGCSGSDLQCDEARGLCGAPDCAPEAEVCDGADNDCDGEIDEEDDCEGGRACVEGACRMPVSGPCLTHEDCAEGDCLTGRGYPGGFCALGCLDDVDCGPDALCRLNHSGHPFCLTRCDEVECRQGWSCGEGVCTPDCAFAGCPSGQICDERSGLCDAPRISVHLGDVVIGPGKQDGDAWDGLGSVDEEVISAISAALSTTPEGLVIGVILELFADDVLSYLEKPDPFGAATISVNGEVTVIDLEQREDTFTPDWARPLVEGADIEHPIQISFNLLDADLANDDLIGNAVISNDDVQAALEQGGGYPVVFFEETRHQIVLISISVVRVN